MLRDGARNKKAEGATWSAAGETLLQRASYALLAVKDFACAGSVSCLGIWGKPVKQADESPR